MNNIAYPYTRAVFAIAKNTNTMDIWLGNLEQLADIIQNPDFASLIGNPKISEEEIIEVLLNVLTKIQSNSNQSFLLELRNFLLLLQENNRLIALPDIAVLFAQLVAEENNVSDAVIQTAYIMSDDVVRQWEQLLSKKLAKKVVATTEVKPELIGGIKVFINDTVIDASIKGSLENLATQLIR